MKACEPLCPTTVALDDVSVTEWRTSTKWKLSWTTVALDDVSVTEWRAFRDVRIRAESAVALDDVSVTEWRSWYWLA